MHTPPQKNARQPQSQGSLCPVSAPWGWRSNQRQGHQGCISSQFAGGTSKVLDVVKPGVMDDRANCILWGPCGLTGCHRAFMLRASLSGPTQVAFLTLHEKIHFLLVASS